MIKALRENIDRFLSPGALVILSIAIVTSFIVASSLGNEPRVLSTLRTCRLSDSMALVV